jgi:hypothetical protein
LEVAVVELSTWGTTAWPVEITMFTGALGVSGRRFWLNTGPPGRRSGQCDPYGLASRTVLNGLPATRRAWLTRLAQDPGQSPLTGMRAQPAPDL